jgi:hypothetical protein
MNVLSKSKFKIGLSCPNKLYYANNKLYVNNSDDNSFLKSLAEGGFQVEAFARLHYPKGHFVSGERGDYNSSFDQTVDLFKKDEVVVYEASFLIDNLFAMSDIVIKQGNKLKIIEVKAKSFDSTEPNPFRGRENSILSGWKPYLFDIAFQKFVAQLCFPDLIIETYFMLADKSKVATIDGLNQQIRLPQVTSSREDTKVLISSENAIKTTVLEEIDVSQIVREILNDEHDYSQDLKFSQALQLLKKTYLKNEFPNWPTNFSACKNCEFKTTSTQENQGFLSGFNSCFTHKYNLSEQELKLPTIFEIWNYRGQKQLDKGIVLLNQLERKKNSITNSTLKLTSSDRRLIQIQKSIDSDPSIFILKEPLIAEMKKWQFPLHFIDFETSAVALPFTSGMSPYEQVAFQFSHHIIHQDGRVIHHSEFLDNSTGNFPNFLFVKELMNSLNKDQGTVFRFASHENSILNSIKNQLEKSTEDNKDQLINFIKSLAKPTNSSKDEWTPTRLFVDLREVVLDFYYHPNTKGSNSIKAILPSILGSCDFLKEKYSKSINEINLTSLNFPDTHRWFVEKNNQVVDPYKLLPSLFENWNEEEKSNTVSGLSDINNGGEALIAYGKLQYTEISSEERDAISNSLKMYCELDTLAMVMIYEHLKHITSLKLTN